MSEQTADSILHLLKVHGPQTAKGLAARLAMTPEGARQHLAKLHRENLVKHRDVREAVGRPKRYWRLSAAGHGRFPDGHSQLMLDMVSAVRDQFGDAGLDRLIEAREAQMKKRYGDHLRGQPSLGARVEALAALRQEEGYMAEVQADGEDGFLLVENHCPICAAAAVCQGFCRSELDVFRQALGPDVQIERSEHILTGARRCAYRISAKN